MSIDANGVDSSCRGTACHKLTPRTRFTVERSAVSDVKILLNKVGF